MGKATRASQLGNGPNNDCGPACVITFLEMLEWGGKQSVEAWAKKIDPEDDGTTAAQLAQMIREFGLTPVLSANPDFPRIELVDYAALPVANRLDTSGKTFGHWILRVSDTEYDDPYLPEGATRKRADKDALDRAVALGAQKYWGGRVESVGIAEAARLMGAARVAYDRVYHVIQAEADEDEAVRIFLAAMRNNKQTVGFSYDDAGVGSGLGSKTAILHGIAQSEQHKYADFYARHYPGTRVVFENAPETELPSAPRPSTGSGSSGQAGVALGINALNRHEEVCYPAAEARCRFFVILDNPGFASALKDRYPDAAVMVRAYWNRNKPGVEEAIARMDGCRDARLIYTGLNEGDEVGQGTVEQIRQRAEFDLALAQRIKQISGATYAAGTISMGEPDFTNSLICSAIRALYSQAYNDGLIWWDHHLYSPSIDHIYDDNGLIWYETRWQFLFEKCGFNPLSKSRVVCSETGEDDGHKHGFAALGRSGEAVAAWARRFVEVQERLLVVDGAEYPSPFVGGALFQAGNREDWNAFNAERYYAALASVWK